MCDTYHCNHLPDTTFVSTQSILVKTGFFFQLFTKLPFITQRLVP